MPTRRFSRSKFSKGDTDMVGKIIGAIMGSRIDRRDGESGIKGALIGAAVPLVAKRIAPLGLLLGGAYVARRLFAGR